MSCLEGLGRGGEGVGGGGDGEGVWQLSVEPMTRVVLTPQSLAPSPHMATPYLPWRGEMTGEKGKNRLTQWPADH